MATKNSPKTAGAGSSGGTVGQVAYRAQQVPGAVVIFAEGFNPTAGYTNYFEESPLEIYPPQFILRSIPPGGIVAQVLTPFAIWVSFGAREPIKTVTVHDDNGEHKIKVEHTLDLKAPESTETLLNGHVMARARLGGEQPTTMATGEESGGGPTTMATGEESFANFATARAIGPMYTLRKKSAYGGLTFTTLFYAEEHDVSHWKTILIGEEGPSVWKTMKFGEEGGTTMVVGEEGWGGPGGGNPFGNF
jgi:hypothetical protein